MKKQNYNIDEENESFTCKLSFFYFNPKDKKISTNATTISLVEAEIKSFFLQ